ncbi:hypothetical protein VMCG_05483 [Cytospora schulzeri]|uniref:NFACT RNA-binding domain-containing protein n=1 Tax=Cytospora schulzeri TaxID=448051 RepID=A0A423WKE4_9PEZI|nr:hypothetical protein VMCG_05483 [Valsa malicola]
MVYYFTSAIVKPSAYVYVGKDKFENKLSSAHIYLRLREGETWDNIPEPLLTDLAQLTKANSIEGNKKDNVTIIYTPWSNLRKDGSMAVGQVSFHDDRKVKKVLVRERENAIINRLNKTKVEKHPDLKQEKDDRLRELRKRDQAAVLARKKEEARIKKEREQLKHQKAHAYDDIFSEENMANSSNQDRDENWEDDFILVDDVGRRPAQLHPLAPEAQVADPRDVLVPVPEVVREEEGQPLDLAEPGALHGQVLDLRGLRQLELLVRGEVLGRLEVDVLLVLEDLEGPGRAGGLRGADEDRVQLDLAGEPCHRSFEG